MAKDEKQNDNTDNQQAEIKETKGPEETKGKQSRKVAELEEQVRDLEAKWKRAVADYQNQEKWMREQRTEWIRSANRELLLRILPVLDTLMLAQLHSDDKNLAVSIGQFLDVLKTEGVTKIETVGKEFDPHLMEAVTTEEGKENTVIKELRAGYLLHDKILRPAQVTVGSGS